MPHLAEIQRSYAKAMLAPVSPDLPSKQDEFLSYLKESRNFSPESSLSIYQSNYHATLRRALEIAYPLTLTLMGGEDFSKLAKLYQEEHSGECASLTFYGSELSQVAAKSSFLEEIPFLPEFIYFEWLKYAALFIEEDQVHDDFLALLSDKQFHEFPIELVSHLLVMETAHPLIQIAQEIEGHNPTDNLEHQHMLLAIWRREDQIMTEYWPVYFKKFLEQVDQSIPIKDLHEIINSEAEAKQCGEFLQLLGSKYLLKI